MSKAIKIFSIIGVVALLFVAGLPTLSAQNELDDDFSPNTESQADENVPPQPGPEDLYPGLDHGIRAVVSEDPILEQLAKYTNVLQETDGQVGAGFRDNVVQGVVVEQEGTDDTSPVPGGSDVVLGLPSRPTRVNELAPGILKAELPEGNFYIQATEEHGVYGKGRRVLMEITRAGRHTFRFPLNAPAGSTAEVLPSNQVLFTEEIDGKKIPVGLIASPWAIDAEGNEVSINQRIEGGQLVITVDTTGAALPVIADPRYQRMKCWNNTGYYGTADAYISGRICPPYIFRQQRGYYPELAETWGRWRGARRSGECSGPTVTIPSRIPFVGGRTIDAPDRWRVRIFGFTAATVFDFQTACKAHDYCYDLIRVRTAGSALFPSVRRESCDYIFDTDMKWDCSHRGGFLNWNNTACLVFQKAFSNAVNWWTNQEGSIPG